MDDPHFSAQERKKEMEDEMDEGEMDDLRGGWEEYVSGGSGSRSGRKRERPASPAVSTKPPEKKSKAATLGGGRGVGYGFGGAMLQEEKAKGLGMAGSTLGGTDRKLGAGPSATVSTGSTVKPTPAPSDQPRSLGSKSTSRASVPAPIPIPVGRSGWACPLCTFHNLADHGRCGELPRTEMSTVS